MNFLQLVQSLRQECGVSGSGPSSTVSQSGEAKRLVDWINAAWLEIQGLHDTWFFMRSTFSFQTVAGTGDYTPTAAGLSDHRYWFKDTLRTYKTALGLADEQWLIEWEYQVFRNTYRFGLQTTQQGRPVVFAEKPMDKALMLGSVLGLVWSPCSGPLLASALTLVASEGGGVRGGVILGLFGLGAAIPLVAVAYASRAGFGKARGWVLGRIDGVKKAFAILLGAMGLLILTGGDKWLEARVNALLPDAWLNLTVLF